MRRCIVSAVLLALSASAAHAQALTLTEPFAPEPGTELAAFYDANAEAVKALNEKVRVGETEDRLRALEELQLAYPDAALSAALELTLDEDKAVAKAAAQLLAESIVMTDHIMIGTMPAGGEEIMARNEAARNALRRVLSDPDEGVRRVSSGILASLSDETALKAISESAENGLISEVEAINYFGLARPEVGAAFIAPYLDGSSEAQQSAVSYLGALPDYQAKIRKEVLLNGEVEEGVRVVAADVLSQYDPDFGSYALALTSNPSIPPSLYTTVMSAYTAQAAINRALTPGEIEAISTSVEEFAKRHEFATEYAAQIQAIQELISTVQSVD